jgi:hypothetical protein
MARRKKKSVWQKIFDWLKPRPKISALLFVVLLFLFWLPVHAYRVHAENQKFIQTRAAIDTAYEQIEKNLGQPDNLKRTSSCSKQSKQIFNTKLLCTAGTNLIYGVVSRSQADILVSQIQKIITGTKLFKALSAPAHITDSLVYDTYYHDALDTYRGPHSIGCSVKYSFDTPEETDLSINSSKKLPFEVFMSCSAEAKRAVYPVVNLNGR